MKRTRFTKERGGRREERSRERMPFGRVGSEGHTGVCEGIPSTFIDSFFSESLVKAIDREL